MKIGFIGLGGMGKLFKSELSQHGHSILGYDVDKKENPLKEVVEQSDVLIFSVPIHKISEAVQSCAPYLKDSQILISQCAVKVIEQEAFKDVLRPNMGLFLIHAMHGPTVATTSETLLKICVQANDTQKQQVEQLLAPFNYEIYELNSANTHDKETADTQALTHLCFLSMGATWKQMDCYPWETAAYAGGVDNLKALLTLRIFSGNAHVYADLATLNPFVKKYAKLYQSKVQKLLSASSSELDEIQKELSEYITDDKQPPLLQREHIEKFKLSEEDIELKPNSHLSLLAMVMTWQELGIKPFSDYLSQTPPYRIRLGLVQYLFRNKSLLKDAFATLSRDQSIRSDDEAFLASVQEWTEIIESADADKFAIKFNSIKDYFKDRLADAKQKSDAIINTLKQSS